MPCARQPLLLLRRFSARPPRESLRDRNRALALTLGAVVVGAVGLSYAAVPLYRMFCQVTGYGGTTSTDAAGTGFAKQAKGAPRPIRIKFNTDVSASLPWSFRPLQREVTVMPGATMLAFFRAKNNSDHPVVGVSTYNVQPSKAGLYFVKIQVRAERGRGVVATLSPQRSAFASRSSVWRPTRKWTCLCFSTWTPTFLTIPKWMTCPKWCSGESCDTCWPPPKS